MLLRMLEDRICVKEDPLPEKSEGGLYLPENAKETPQRGEVLFAGQGRYEHGTFVANPVGAGDVVLYGRYAGSSVEIPEHGEVLIMRASDVLAVLEPDDYDSLPF